ncbi:UNVERIFIED_CONTAM: hypothetical protein Scaly_2575700 [Sesamum calycinum]|uniref:DUF4283 domain-containing protein n=1 Tax=Sesamum calycinum TaxID=2727403 RepID=A0AAW2JJB1_9LAMI
MEAALDKMGRSLILTEEEDLGLVLPTGVWHSESENRGFHLVGRILSHKPYNAEALQSILRTAFNPAKGMKISFIENDLLIQFFHTIDRERVVESGPWAFDKNLILLSKVSDNENPAEVDLNWCDFHVRIHGLPIGKMTKEVANHIGRKIGRLRNADQQTEPESWGSFMRLRVALEEGFVDPGEDTLFGPWLRAATGSVSRNRGYQLKNVNAHVQDCRPRFKS